MEAKRSAAMCVALPVPPELYSIAPGFARATSINSLTDATGSVGCTDSQYGCHRIVVTAAKSFAVSKGSFG